MNISNRQASGLLIEFDPAQLTIGDITEVGFSNAPGFAQSVQLVGNLAYVADALSGLRVLDVSNPASITQLGAFDTLGSVSDVQVVGNLAYVADGSSGLRVLDVSNPANITELGAFDTPGFARDVQVVGNLAYVADALSGLRVLDVSNPASITELGAFDTFGYAHTVQVMGNLAYVADGDSGLSVLDVSDPTTIGLVNFFDTFFEYYDVQVVGGLAYVADNSGLRVFDVSSPFAITEVGFFDTPGLASRVQVVDDLVYVACGSGLQVLDVSDPAAITEVGFFNTPGFAWDVQVVGGLAYVADDSGGLRVLGLTNARATATIENDDSAKVILASVVNIATQQLEGDDDDPTSLAQFEFSVTLDHPVPGGFTLRYLVRDGAINPVVNPGRAELGKDYIVDDSVPYNQFSGGVGTLTFTGNANERLFIDLTSIGDTVVEADEFFNIELDTITLNDAAIDPSLVTVSDEKPGDRRQQGVILNRLDGMPPDDQSQLSLAFAGKFPSPNGGDPIARFEVTSSNGVQEGFQVDLVVDLLSVSGASSALTFADSNSRRTVRGSFTGNPGERRSIDVPIPPSTTMLNATLGNVSAAGAGVNPADILPAALLAITLPDNAMFVTAAGPGGGPHVKVFKSSGIKEFFAFGGGFIGGVRLATGDVTGDGVSDIITAAGPGGGPDVRVFDGVTLMQINGPLGDFYAYPGNFTGGVYVAVADLDGDNRANIITGPGQGGGPNVRVFRSSDGAMIRNFYAYPGGFAGGVRVAAADVNGDGTPDIITSPGPGGGPDVRVFDGTTNGMTIPGPLGDFYAYPGNFTGGVYVAAADLDGDNRPDIITGPDAGGGPNVRVFRASDGAMIMDFYAYGNFTGGVRVAAADVNGDVIPDIITTPGPGGGPDVRVFDGTTNGMTIPGPLGDFYAYGNFTGGVYVAAADAIAGIDVDVIAEAGAGGGNAAPQRNPICPRLWTRQSGSSSKLALLLPVPCRT